MPDPESISKSPPIKGLGIFTAALFLFSAAVSHPGLYSHIANSIWGGGDAALYVFLTKKNIDYFISPGRELFDLPFFYPFHDTLAFSDNYLLPSSISCVVFLLTHNLILSFNTPLLLAAWLNGYLAFLLARRVLTAELPAILAGLTFQLCGFFFAQQIHPQLEYAFIIPLGTLALFRFIESNDRRWAACLGASLLLALLCSVYYFFILLLVFGLVLGAFFCSRKAGKDRILSHFPVLFVWNIPQIVLTGALLLPYLRVAALHGVRRLESIESPASLLAFLSAAPDNILYGRLSSSWTNPETHFFIGGLALLLAVLGFFGSIREIFSAGRKRLFLTALILLAAAAILINCGFHSQISAAMLGIFLLAIFLFFLSCFPCCFPGENKNNLNFPLLLFLLGVELFILSLGRTGNLRSSILSGPFVLLHHYIPGFSALRAAGRLSIFPLLAISVFAGAGAKLLLDRFIGGQRIAVALLFAVIIALESSHQGTPFFSLPPALPESLSRTLSQTGAPVIVLPFPGFVHNETEFSALQTDYMLRMIELRNPLVNGYSGVVPRFHAKLGARLSNPLDRASFSILQSIPDLRYIVTLSDSVPVLNASSVGHEIAQSDLPLKHLGSEQGAFLYEILPEK